MPPSAPAAAVVCSSIILFGGGTGELLKTARILPTCDELGEMDEAKEGAVLETLREEGRDGVARGEAEAEGVDDAAAAPSDDGAVEVSSVVDAAVASMCMFVLSASVFGN